MTDYPYKAKIEEAVATHADRFCVPDTGAREFPLQNHCRADFCFHIKPKGQLFIEDDDGARGLSNLVKYWIWCDDHPDERPVHFIHILETTRPAQVENIDFVGQRTEKAIPGFSFHMIKIANWQAPDEDWLPSLRRVLNAI